MLGKVPCSRPRALQKREWNFWRFRRRISLITSSEPIRVRSFSQLVNSLWEISIFLFSTDIRAICMVVCESKLFKLWDSKSFKILVILYHLSYNLEDKKDHDRQLHTCSTMFSGNSFSKSSTSKMKLRFSGRVAYSPFSSSMYGESGVIVSRQLFHSWR